MYFFTTQTVQLLLLFKFEIQSSFCTDTLSFYSNQFLLRLKFAQEQLAPKQVSSEALWMRRFQKNNDLTGFSTFLSCVLLNVTDCILFL